MNPIRQKPQLHRSGFWPRTLAGTLIAMVLVSGCAVGPGYRKPAVAAPMAYKEAAGWKPAMPSDALEKGSWWEVFGDPVLSDLERRAATANQTLAQAEATYEQERQLARADHASFFPNLSIAGSAQRSQSGAGRSLASGGGGGTSVITSSKGPANTFSASLGASWTPDFWGRIRRQTQSDVAAAQAGAADLANARLSIQSTLAQTYLQLRIADERVRLRQTAVDAYTRTLDIAQNKYRVGIVARSDVSSAQAQLDGARAQRIDAGIQRAQLEHAIAVLIGVPPALFALPEQPALHVTVPAAPVRLPSTLLERRPDIASAERTVAAANARVGVQVAAYFPQISLSADGGFSHDMLSGLFNTPNRFWSLGASLTDTLLDFGRRRANVAAAHAAYDANVAAYRAAVLRAFQQVEDDLVSLRLLEAEAKVQQSAVNEAAEAARIALNEYRAGTVDYTTVATAQVNELDSRLTALTVLQNQLTSAVGLIEALGGGWSTAELPDARAVLTRSKPQR